MKKLLLGLGTLAAIVAPITTVVACGTGQDHNDGGTQGPSNLDSRSWNHGAIETSVDDEQMTGNGFVSTEATQQSRDATIEAANSITKAQIEALINISPDSTEFPTQVRNLPQSFLVRASNNVDVLATLTWTPNDIDGSLTWTATISDRTEPAPIGTILGFKDATTANKEIEVATANSITKAQIEALINISPDSTELPSQVANLPQSLQVTASNNTNITAILTWTPNDINGSLTWRALISDRTEAQLTGTFSGFKSIEAANSITKAQIEALININPDSTEFPSQVANLPQSLQVTASNNTNIIAALTWTPNDIDGSLTWKALISDRTEAILTGTISGFKDVATANKWITIATANSITQAQIEANIHMHVSSDPTKLPSEVTNLPHSLQVIASNNTSVTVTLTWTPNDIDGSLTWRALISDSTKAQLTGTIYNFKNIATIDGEEIIEIANSVTKVQIESLIHVSADSTEFPSQVRNLPQSLQVIAINNADVLAALTWTPNDIDGSLTWTAAISDRTEDAPTGTISGFKDKVTADREAIMVTANSITNAQIEALISVRPDWTKLPSNVANLPQSLLISSNNTKVNVTLTWTPNDIGGSLTWTAAIGTRTKAPLTGTIFGFKGIATANSITETQIKTIIGINPDWTKLPSEVTNLPQSLQVMANNDTKVAVTLTWTPNDIDGSLTWIAAISDRTENAPTGTIYNFKNAITTNDAIMEAANLITHAQLVALIGGNSDPTKLPSEVTNLPQSLQVTASNNTNVAVTLTWVPNDIDGSLIWTATISTRTKAQLTGTISGFKDASTANNEITIEAANSITETQIKTIIGMNPDWTKLPSEVTNLPHSLQIIASNNTKVDVTLTWVPNDIDGSLTWKALISDRTKAPLTETVFGFKGIATANSITQAQIEANIHMHVSSDPTKLPSEVTNLPHSLQIIASNNTKVDVTLTWTPNDIDGSFSWIAVINSRTEDAPTGTISGFKDKATADREAIIEAREAIIVAANSITQTQIEGQLTSLIADSTKFPSEVIGLPTTINVVPATDSSASVIVSLTWTQNDINGSLMWKALISDRTEPAPFGAISGFKDASIANKEITIEAANSITKAQIEALININPDSTEFPTQVRNLPQSFLVRASNNIDVLATLTWTPNDIDGSLTWRALISDRTEPTPFGTILGFKDATTANKEIEVATANSITKAQIEANIHMYVSSDLTKLPSKVTNLPQSLQVIANNNTKVAATLTWTPNDIDGSLTWTATISDRTKATLTGTISGFKSIEATNSITKAQIEALIHVSSDTTKLPSEVMNLPQSLQVIANNNTKVDVTLTWTPNDIDGSLTWTAAISDRTEDAPTGTISGFKDKATADREAIIEAANLITYAQLVDLIGGNSDPTKLPSEIIGLPTTINVVSATDSSASVIVSLTWTPNDIDGSLTWRALISDRTEAILTGTILGFKDVATANANSITKAQIESLIHVSADSTEFPTQVRNLPQLLQVTTSDGINIDVTLTWTPNDIDGSLTWTVTISDRTEPAPFGTILGFKDATTANK